MYQRILVPFDGSASAMRALDEALALARPAGATVRLVHGIDELKYRNPQDSAGRDDLLPLMEEAGEIVLQQGRSRAQALGVRAESVLYTSLSQPLSAIVAEQVAAWHPDLVVQINGGTRPESAQGVTMNQAISALMKRPVFSVGMDDTVAQVEALLSSQHLTWVPVLEPTKREVAGVISASDLVAFRSQGRDAASTRAWQMCTYKPVVVDAETPIAMVAALMVERGIHHVVVTDRNGIAGVASSLDFVRTFVPSRQA